MGFTQGIVKSKANSSAGAYSYLDAGGEQDVVEITPSNQTLVIRGIWLDLTNMTQNGTIKLYHKIDGTNYRQLSVNGTEQSYSFTVADAVDGFYIPYNFMLEKGFKVTYEEGGDEGAARSINYSIMYEVLSAA